MTDASSSQMRRNASLSSPRTAHNLPFPPSRLPYLPSYLNDCLPACLLPACLRTYNSLLALNSRSLSCFHFSRPDFLFLFFFSFLFTFLSSSPLRSLITLIFFFSFLPHCFCFPRFNPLSHFISLSLLLHHFVFHRARHVSSLFSLICFPMLTFLPLSPFSEITVLLLFFLATRFRDNISTSLSLSPLFFLPHYCFDQTIICFQSLFLHDLSPFTFFLRSFSQSFPAPFTPPFPTRMDPRK